jgi:hypothetical protein
MRRIIPEMVSLRSRTEDNQGWWRLDVFRKSVLLHEETGNDGLLIVDRRKWKGACSWLEEDERKWHHHFRVNAAWCPSYWWSMQWTNKETEKFYYILDLFFLGAQMFSSSRLHTLYLRSILVPSQQVDNYLIFSSFLHYIFPFYVVYFLPLGIIDRLAYFHWRGNGF